MSDDWEEESREEGSTVAQLGGGSIREKIEAVVESSLMGQQMLCGLRDVQHLLLGRRSREVDVRRHDNEKAS